MRTSQAFYRSLKKWGAEQGGGDELGWPVEEYLLSTLPQSKEDSTTPFDVLMLAMRPMVNQAARKIFQYLEQIGMSLGSPIEAMFLAAFLITVKETENGVRVVTDYPLYGDRDDEYQFVINVEPQKKIGDFRVDFLLSVYTELPDMERMEVNSKGIEVAGCKRISTKLIVECDGHDFHERTKEQARNDKSRDRVLQSVGYKVFRFTGSELWRDPFRCAEQTLQAIQLDIDLQYHGNDAYRWHKHPFPI
jgi:very-short-patch-repair endonuclease